MPGLRRETPASAFSRTFRRYPRLHPLPADARYDGRRRRTSRTHRRMALGCGHALAGVAIDVRPGLCRSHNRRWSSRRDHWLPLCQELRKLGTAATLLLVRTRRRRPSRWSRNCSSAAQRKYRAATRAVRARSLSPDPQVATCGSRHAVGPDVVVAVGANALLSLWRGHADPAPQSRPGPRFDPTRGLSRAIARDAQFASCAPLPGSGR